MEPHRNYIAKTHKKLAITSAKVKSKYNLFSIIVVFTILPMKTHFDRFLKLYVSQEDSSNANYGPLGNI